MRRLLVSAKDIRVYSGAGRLLAGPLSMDLFEGEWVAMVGPSGAGKTLLLTALMGLPPRGGRLEGEAVVAGVRTVPPSRDSAKVRGRVIGYCPQDAHSSLNPFRTVRSQMTELVRVLRGRKTTKSAAEEVVLSLLEKVGLTPAGEFALRYPHQLSGGQAQRVALAMALAGDVSLLFLDEPTASLDRATAGAIWKLLKEVREFVPSALVVTHSMREAEVLCEKTVRVDPVREGF